MKLKCLIFVAVLSALFVTALVFTGAMQAAPPNRLTVTVTAENGDPVAGASVFVDFHLRGISDGVGRYTFENNGESVYVSAPGFLPQLEQILPHWNGALRFILTATSNFTDIEKPLTTKVLLNGEPLAGKEVLIKSRGLIKRVVTGKNGELATTVSGENVFIAYQVLDAQANNGEMYIQTVDLKSAVDSYIVLGKNRRTSIRLPVPSDMAQLVFTLRADGFFFQLPFSRSPKAPVFDLTVYSGDYDFFDKYVAGADFRRLYTGGEYAGYQVIGGSWVQGNAMQLEYQALLSEMAGGFVLPWPKPNYHYDNDFMIFERADGEAKLHRVILYDLKKKEYLSCWYGTRLAIPLTAITKNTAIVVEQFGAASYDMMLSDCTLRTIPAVRRTALTISFP